MSGFMNNGFHFPLTCLPTPPNGIQGTGFAYQHSPSGSMHQPNPFVQQSGYHQPHTMFSHQQRYQMKNSGLFQVPFHNSQMQQFASHNYDSQYNHPRHQSPRTHRQANSPDLCDSIKKSILNQLRGCETDSPQTPMSYHADHTDEPNTPKSSDRGTKRRLKMQTSPVSTKKIKQNESEEGSSVIIPSPTPDRNSDPMSCTINNFYEKHKQKPETFMAKMRLREALYAVMKGVFPYCGLYVVGSSMNGFGFDTSDMDICLMLSQAEIDQKKEATEILRILLGALRKCTFLRELLFIRAKVPILKFKDKISGAECDLNINNSVGIRNTHMLNAYAKMDWRLAPLVVFIKHWAKFHNINDASQGTVSSYSLVLMVIHYLQCGCDPPALPSLQQKYPQSFSSKLDIRLLTLNEKLPHYTSQNQQSLGELFCGFMEYYATRFDFKEDAISVRLACKLPRHIVVRQSLQKGHLQTMWKCIGIEEPFDLSNTARSVYSPATFMRILRVIRTSHSKLKQTGKIYTVLRDPF